MTLRRHRQSGGPGTAIMISLCVTLVVAGSIWWWLRTDDGSVPPAVPPTTTSQDAPSDLPTGPEPLDLPALGASDVLIRELVEALSSHPTLASWLVTDELVRRFVGVVVELAGGLSPRSRIQFLIPDAEFHVLEPEGSIVLDPASYQRYDLLAEVFSSVDIQGGAQLYLELYPLFQEAYEELGIPDGDFGSAMALAVENVVSADLPAGAVELRPNESVYEFVSGELEARSPVEKHLIRMGPENARTVQAKVNDLWRAIVSGGQPITGR